MSRTIARFSDPAIGTYCRRCDRYFGHFTVKAQHIQASSLHNLCGVCSYDGPSWQDLLSHYSGTKHMQVCWGCNDGEGDAWVPGSREYRHHLEADNVCRHCDRHFDNKNNLHHHQITHLPPSEECLGCYKKFRNYGSMMIHLESGACRSGVDILDLNEWAAQCYQWEHYLDGDYREDMLDRVDIREEYGIVYPFFCPTCGTQFSLLSGLFQHLGSPACDERVDGFAMSKLMRWFMNNMP